MQPLIHINQTTCIKCSYCADVCPNKIFSLNESNEIIIRQDRVESCFQCGQCMAICSTESIVINGLSYEKDFFDLPHQKFSGIEMSFLEMIKTRRAIRNFKDRPVPREVLDKIVEAISFAPPSFPPLKIKIVVVRNTKLIRQALPHMINFYNNMVQMMKNPFIRFLIKKEVGKKRMKTIQNHLIPLLINRLPALKSGEEDTLTRNAPAMILFLADKNGEDISQDVSIAATYGMLAIHSLGLGGSIMDIIPPAIEKDKYLRMLFCIPDDHEVVTSIILGYPKYKYLRGIKRNIKDVQWL